MGEDEGTALRMLSRHNQLIQPIVQVHEGKIIKRMGDGLLVEFLSAVRAVQCAIAIQKKLIGFNTQVEEKDRIWLRIGIHLGDILITGQDILGDGVNIASRIEPLAEPGGICISQDIYNQIKGKMEVEAISIGPQDLKNISRQVEIYKVLAEAMKSHNLKPPVVTATHHIKRLKMPKWMMIGGIVFIVLFLAIVFSNAGKNDQSKMAYENLIKESNALIKDEKYDEAVKKLEGFPKEFLNPQREEEIKKILHEINRKQLINRALAYQKLLDMEEGRLWPEFKKFILPDLVQKIESDPIAKAVVTAKLKTIRRELVSVKFESAELKQDGKQANIIYEIKTKKDTIKLVAEWIKAENNWYIIVKDE